MQTFRFGPSDVALFGAADVREWLDMASCVVAVEGAFARLAKGEAPVPGVLGFEVEGGGFHLKAGLSGDGYFAAKVNGNFPDNPGRGLPTIQGLVVLADARDGTPLAVVDSAELTARRTGAATGVAVKHLAKMGAVTVTICGCGRQAASQLEAVAAVREVGEVFAADVNRTAADRLAVEMGDTWRIRPVAWERLIEFSRQSDVVITCTPSREAFLGVEHARPGALVAAVGADNAHKQELDPELMKRSCVIADVLDQCAVMGDLHHAIAANVMGKDDVYAELGEVVIGRKRGRPDEDRVYVFDSTGMALQDVVAAALVYERARSAG